MVSVLSTKNKNPEYIPHFTKQIQSFFEGKGKLSIDQIQAKDFKFSQGEYEVTEEQTPTSILLGDTLVGKPIYGSGAKKSEFDG